MPFDWNRHLPSCKRTGGSWYCITLLSARHYTEKIQKFLLFSVPADWKSQSTDFVLPPCFTVTLTTAYLTAKLRPAFPSITSRRQRYRKPENLTARSEEHTSELQSRV